MKSCGIKSWMGIGIVLSYALTDVHAQNLAQSLVAPAVCAVFIFVSFAAVCSRIKGNGGAPSDMGGYDGGDC